jgi:hypothetical protein
MRVDDLDRKEILELDPEGGVIRVAGGRTLPARGNNHRALAKGPRRKLRAHGREVIYKTYFGQERNWINS